MERPLPQAGTRLRFRRLGRGTHPAVGFPFSSPRRDAFRLRSAVGQRSVAVLRSKATASSRVGPRGSTRMRSFRLSSDACLTRTHLIKLPQLALAAKDACQGQRDERQGTCSDGEGTAGSMRAQISKGQERTGEEERNATAGHAGPPGPARNDECMEDNERSLSRG